MPDRDDNEKDITKSTRNPAWRFKGTSSTRKDIMRLLRTRDVHFANGGSAGDRVVPYAGGCAGAGRHGDALCDPGRRAGPFRGDRSVLHANGQAWATAFGISRLRRGRPLGGEPIPGVGFGEPAPRTVQIGSRLVPGEAHGRDDVAALYAAPRLRGGLVPVYLGSPDGSAHLRRRQHARRNRCARQPPTQRDSPDGAAPDGVPC